MRCCVNSQLVTSRESKWPPEGNYHSEPGQIKTHITPTPLTSGTGTWVQPIPHPP